MRVVATLLSLPCLAVVASPVFYLPINITNVKAVNHLFKRDWLPANADVQKMVTPLKAKLQLDVCGKGIKPGEAADMDWVEKHVFPKYLSKIFIGKALPDGLLSDVDSLIVKCHKNTYNYCLSKDRDAALMCAKDEVGGLIMKYGNQLLTYCPVIRAIIKGWSSKDEKEALALIDQYIAFKRPS